MAYSMQKAVSDGTLDTIVLGVQYLQRNDIYMRIAGEATPQSGASSGYTWYFQDATTLKINPVVPTGIEVVIYRKTDLGSMYNVYSQNAQFDEATIDENNQQLLFIGQEYLEQGLPGAGVESVEFVRADASNQYYRLALTDGSFTPEFAIPKQPIADFYNVGTFAAGYNALVNGSETLTYDGHAYSWSGAFPKVVAAGSTPTPLGSGGWIDRRDVNLRVELSVADGHALVGGVSGVFENIQSLKIFPVVDGRTYETTCYRTLSDCGGAKYVATTDTPRVGADLVANNGLTLRLLHGDSVMSTKLGIAHDYNSTSKTGTDNRVAIQNAFLFSATYGVEVIFGFGFALVKSSLYPVTGMLISGLGVWGGIVGSDDLANSAIDYIMSSKISPDNPHDFKTRRLHLHSDLSSSAKSLGKRIGGMLMDWTDGGSNPRGGYNYTIDDPIFTEFKQFSFAGFGSVDSSVNRPVVKNNSPYLVDGNSSSGSGYDGVTFSGSRRCWIRFANVTESGDSGVGMTADAMDGGIINCTVTKILGGAGPCLDMLGATNCVAAGNILHRDGVTYNNGTSCLQIGRKNAPNIGGFGNSITGNVCRAGTTGGGALCLHCEGATNTGEAKNTVSGNQFIITGNPSNPGVGLKRHVNIAADNCVLSGNQYSTKDTTKTSTEPDSTFDPFVSSAIYAEQSNNCSISDVCSQYSVEIGSGCDAYTLSAPFACSTLYMHDGAVSARTSKLYEIKCSRLRIVNLSGAIVELINSNVSNFFGIPPIHAEGNVRLVMHGGRVDRVTSTNDVNAVELQSVSEFISIGVQYVLSGGGTGLPIQSLGGAPAKYFIKENIHSGAFSGILAGGIAEASTNYVRYLASENYRYEY